MTKEQVPSSRGDNAEQPIGGSSIDDLLAGVPTFGEVLTGVPTRKRAPAVSINEILAGVPTFGEVMAPPQDQPSNKQPGKK